MSEQTVRYTSPAGNQTLAGRRVQLICQVLLRMVLGSFAAAAACVLTNYLSMCVEEYLNTRSVLLAGVSCIYVCMIIIALCCVHDFTVDVAVRIRWIKMTYRDN